MDDWELIEAYARQQSESAFRTLAERYAGLVYASALRQVGNPQLAQDISQAVFILLARRAGSLSRETVLSGWLFQTTRFLAYRAIRTEQRRQKREEEAIAMQEMNSPDAAWRRMEPVIDEALNQLGRVDREAILLCYLEGRSMREVATRLGLTDEAAKKRVQRAVEKLRRLLARQGVSLTTALIASAIMMGANAAVPGTVLASIVATAMAETTSGAAAAMASEALATWRLARLKLVTGIGAAALLVALVVVVTFSRQRREDVPQTAKSEPSAEDVRLQLNKATVPSAQPLPTSNFGQKTLRLWAVDAATGITITNAPVAFTTWMGETIQDHYELVTDGSGRCDIPLGANVGRLDAGVYVSGWAARFATWPSDGSAVIPGEYTLRLERTTNVLGGQILDPSGQPLAGARVYFEASGTGDYAQRERPRERFGFVRGLPILTGAQGFWNMAFVPARHPGFQISVTHPLFPRTFILSSSAQESLDGITDKDLQSLWKGELQTRMKSGWTVTGTVVDENGKTVRYAKIQEREQSQVYKTDDKGVFNVPGLPEGPWGFTASADGFSPLRTNVQISATMKPILLTLKPGGVLRIHVVDEDGLDVPEATIGLEQWGENRHSLDWRDKTSWDGRLEWQSAPRDTPLEVYARKEGFCFTRDVRLTADNQEHEVRLHHALDVYGRVVDAETSHAIRDFKAVPGYGFSYHDMSQRWFEGETVRGTNGLFKLSFVEKPTWQLRIAASGYEDWISGDLQTNKFSTTLDIALKRQSPEEAVRGNVLKPDGTPATGAQVVLLSLENNARLLRTKAFGGNKRWLTKCGEAGEFRFPFNQSAHSVAAASVDGFAQVRIADIHQPITLQLQPWGYVEGVVDDSAKAEPIESIELYDPAADNYQGRVSLLGTYSTKVDANGRFAFENVPPGDFSVFINSLRGIPYHHQTPVQVAPGQTTQVTIVEQPGVLLKGRLVAPPSKILDWTGNRIHVSLRPESLRYAPGWSSKDEHTLKAVDYWTSKTARDFVNSRRSVSLRVNEDGSFVSVERAEAGNYQFIATFENLSAVRKIAITAEQEQLPVVDLGIIELR